MRLALFSEISGRDEQTIEAFWAGFARFWGSGTSIRIITNRSISCEARRVCSPPMRSARLNNKDYF